MRSFLMVVTGMLAASTAHAGVVFTDVNDFFDTLGMSMVEDFETKNAPGPLDDLDFGTGMDAAVSGSGVVHNETLDGPDGAGALANSGQAYWKVLGESITIDFGTAAFEAFGFHYSDLERDTLDIILHGTQGDQIFSFTDFNRDVNNFFGVTIDDDTFSSVTIDWRNDARDGIGIDDVVVGTLAIPAPAATLPLSLLVLSRRRR